MYIYVYVLTCVGTAVRRYVLMCVYVYLYVFAYGFNDTPAQEAIDTYLKFDKGPKAKFRINTRNVGLYKN